MDFATYRNANHQSTGPVCAYGQENRLLRTCWESMAGRVRSLDRGLVEQSQHDADQERKASQQGEGPNHG